MSAEENKAVLRRWIEAYNERDLEVEAAVLARDYVAHVPAAPGPLEGLEAVQWLLRGGVFPDLRLTAEDVLSFIYEAPDEGTAAATVLAAISPGHVAL